MLDMEVKKQNMKYVAENICDILRDNKVNIEFHHITYNSTDDYYYMIAGRDIPTCELDRIKIDLAAKLGVTRLEFEPAEFEGHQGLLLILTNDYGLLKTDSLVHNTAMLIKSIQWTAERGHINTSSLISHFNLSYARARKIMEQMRVMGIIENVRAQEYSVSKIPVANVTEYKELLKDMCRGQEPPEYKPDDTRLLRLLSLFNVEADLRVVRRTPTTIILEYSFNNKADYKKVKELSTELSMRLNAPSFRIIQGVKYEFGAEIANDELHLLEWK